MAGVPPADAVSQRDLIGASRPRIGQLVHGEEHTHRRATRGLFTIASIIDSAHRQSGPSG